MQLKSLNPNLGLEIKDVDLATLSDADFDRIEGLFNQHMVLVFRDQTLSREQHKAFAKRFGDIHIHPSHRGGMKGKGDDPELFVIDTPADSKITNGELWHSDVSCEVIPPMASLPISPRPLTTVAAIHCSLICVQHSRKCQKRFRNF